MNVYLNGDIVFPQLTPPKYGHQNHRKKMSLWLRQAAKELKTWYINVSTNPLHRLTWFFPTMIFLACNSKDSFFCLSTGLAGGYITNYFLGWYQFDRLRKIIYCIS